MVAVRFWCKKAFLAEKTLYKLKKHLSLPNTAVLLSNTGKYAKIQR